MSRAKEITEEDKKQWVGFWWVELQGGYRYIVEIRRRNGDGWMYVKLPNGATTGLDRIYSFKWLAKVPCPELCTSLDEFVDNVRGRTDDLRLVERASEYFLQDVYCYYDIVGDPEAEESFLARPEVTP